MKQRNWILFAIIVVLVGMCCCLASIGVAGWEFLRAVQDPSVWQDLLPDTEPTPVVRIETRAPTEAERAAALRALEAQVPERDLLALAVRLGRLAGPVAGTLPPPDAPPRVGDTHTFWVHDQETDRQYTTTATLAFVSPSAYWWVEDGFEIPPEDLETSASHFDQTVETNRRVFGSEPNPGIDGDPRIYVFLGQVNGVGGYFSGPDEYPQSVAQFSNEHEMFYINLDNAMPGSDYFDGILAHEFQHMIHWAVDTNEDTWVNEGLAELAVQINGYDVGGSDRAFASNPDTQLTTWPELEDSSRHYGAAYLFMAYVLDRYGEQAIRSLAADPANGADSVEALLAVVEPGLSFDGLFADWVAANYLDDAGGNGRYSYSSIYAPAPSLAARHVTYPTYQEATVHQYGTDYILLDGQGDVTVEFTGSLLIPLTGPQPRSGNLMWWSNRADEGDATLTRAFDLTGLTSATLDMWTWYYLETDYDYAYVEVSTNGELWTLLENEHTTRTNPNGSSYGPALTGVSGGGETPVWVRQKFDLSPFAGKQVLVRLEVITDDTLNYPGVCVDDFTVPELGFADGAEAVSAGWDAEGWVRITGNVPEYFIVQVISMGKEPTVERIALDEHNRGRVTVRGLGADVEQAVLVVSGAAPLTTEWASYSYRLTQP